MSAGETAPTKAAQARSNLYPLDEFYALRGQPMPAIEIVDAGAIPEPSRSLLEHKTDMTSTLENFHGVKLHVEVLERRNAGNEYFREVALRLGPNGRVVEYGAIRIMLDLLPENVRSDILGEQKPLGRILTESGFFFSSRPRLYLRVRADLFISQALGLTGPRVLYGRRNTLTDSWKRPLAEIVEILPPS